MEKYEDAIVDLTKLLDIEPNNKFALRYRAETYYLIEKYKELFNDVNKLLNIDINDEWPKIIEKKVFAQFEKSTNMGHAEGINCLGYCYEYGIGVEKNENKSFTYYQKSANMSECIKLVIVII
ncbi:hypothetical protein C2G38_2309723 [Gigaspora rosea]|uniref:Uncharacterized protein n=1 Tax=Gigaspora rosea TaxID=44941 RepID=A0A397VAD1_9GLOM|nr:hypothetical protein C2G38_2309723 [Gigaspora rosea]